MSMKVILVLSHTTGVVYNAADGEKVSDILYHVNTNYPGNSEFAKMILMLIDFHMQYKIAIEKAKEQEIDTLIFNCDIMTALKNNNTLKDKKFNDMMSLGYKLLKVDGFQRPDEIYYFSDGGAIDEYCARNTWETAAHDVKVISIE